MRLLNDNDVSSLFDIDLALSSQRRAFTALARGEAWQPEKIMGGYPDGTDTVFNYAARVNPSTGPVCKFGSINPDNAEHGLPTIHAVVTVMDPQTGAPLAVMDGTALTTRRTAAASAVAVEALGRRDWSRVLVLGAGVQARAHIETLCRLSEKTTFELWSPRRSSMGSCIEVLGNQGIVVEPATCLQEAMHRADVIICATLATEPLFSAADLRPGATVVAVGSFESHRREVDLDVLRQSTIVAVDHRSTALQNCGPLVACGSDTERLEIVEIGDLLTGSHCGRTNDTDIVSYFSAGLGIQDAAAAWSIYERAQAQQIGQLVDWDAA